MTATLSLAAFQVSLTWPDAGWVYARFAGALGGWVSPELPVRVTLLLAADWLPAASWALTV